MSRPLVLLPPAKGKAPGGDGPAYAATLAADALLEKPRAQLLAAARDAAATADAVALARLCGVRRADVAAARDLLARLADGPTMPAHRRYAGIVHGNAGLAAMDPDRLEVDALVVSPLLGLAALDTPVPAYRLELAASLPGLGGLGTFWRRHVGPVLSRLSDGRRTWDLLPGEHARVWPPSARGAADVVTVRFVRPDGRAANAARTKVAKGRIAHHLLTTPTATPRTVARDAVAGDGWTLAVDGDTVIATFHE